MVVYYVANVIMFYVVHVFNFNIKMFVMNKNGFIKNNTLMHVIIQVIINIFHHIQENNVKSVSIEYVQIVIKI
jgi:hypothetical protein